MKSLANKQIPQSSTNSRSAKHRSHEWHQKYKVHFKLCNDPGFSQILLFRYGHLVNNNEGRCSYCDPDMCHFSARSQIAKYANIWLIWLHVMNMAKWGIPEKSIKNVAQRRRPWSVRDTPVKSYGPKYIFGNSPIYIP